MKYRAKRECETERERETGYQDGRWRYKSGEEFLKNGKSEDGWLYQKSDKVDPFRPPFNLMEKERKGEELGEDAASEMGRG